MSFSMGSSSFVEIMSTATKTLAKSGGEASAPTDKTPAKARKPYTITKQRERWTEDEHQKFLEALKLYGRAWRRIEEHIGTKTAVQIRSHAQKFFSKLEREASTGGSLASADVEIPPPRPKRKPTHPYPRKEGLAMSSTPSSEEESKSTTVTSPLEDPVERTSGRNLCNSLLKVAQAAQAGQELSSSLRLFGKTVTVEGSSVLVSDAHEQHKPSGLTAVKESESTGSPRSQLTMEETSAMSMLSSADVCKVEVDAPVYLTDGVMAENEFLNKANADSKTQDISCVGLVAEKMNQPSSLPANQTISNAFQYGYQPYQGTFTFPGPTSCGILFPFWHPCYAMPSALPSLFPAALPPGWNDTKEDGDAAAAIAAATFLIASAWQAIQGTAPMSKEHANTSMVYCPVAIAATTNSKRSSNPLGKETEDEPVPNREHNASSIIDKYEPISDTPAPDAECTGDNCDNPDTDGEAQERKRLKRMHDGKEGEFRIHSSCEASMTLNGASTIPVSKEREGNASCDAKIDVQTSSDSDDAGDVATLANAYTEMHQGQDILRQKSQECSSAMENSLLNTSNSCHSEPPFMMRTGVLSNSRYSGAGFVPYKKTSAPVESSAEAGPVHR